MTTSEPQKGAPLKPASDFSTSLPGSELSIPPGLPDTETLARMANEFFTALPLTEGALPLSTDSVPGASATSSRFASPSPHDLPSETRIHSALAALPQVPAIPGAIMSPPGLPGSPELARFSDPSAFAFLEEARPLFGFVGLTTAAPPNLDAIKIPTETDLRALADEFSTTPPPRVSDSQIPQTAPQFPGAPAAPNPSELSLGYSFLNDIRHLVALPSFESVAPQATAQTPNDFSSLNL